MIRNSEMFTVVYLTINFIRTFCTDKNDTYNQVQLNSLAVRGKLSDDPKILRADYRWHPSDELFDCIVALTFQGNHIATGIIFWHRFIIMSASPWEQFPWGKQFHSTPENLEAHAVHHSWNRSRSYPIKVVLGNQLQRKNWFWVGFGIDKKHSPVHDILIMETHYRKFEFLEKITHHFRHKPYKNRRPFFVKRATPENFTSKPTRWRIAGFGFVDEADVRDTKQLRVFDYGGDVIEDCDDWIPRPWGHFICIANVDNLIGIAAGAGLFHDRQLVAIGAFEITKAKDSILVFTNLAKYNDRTFHTEGW